MNKNVKITKRKMVCALMVVSLLMSSMILPQEVSAATKQYNTPIVRKPIFNVTFNPNRGRVKTKRKKVQYTNIYGSLPTPRRNKYVFRGWYSKKSGGHKITQYSRCNVKKNSTLYARWQKKKSYDKLVMRYINKYRKKKRLVKLKWDKKLSRGTAKRAREITRKFAHKRPNGGSGARFLLKYVKRGRSSGECLGKGFSEPCKLVKAFMKSPSHRRIIMSGKARTCAATSKVKRGVRYWCVGTSALYRK